MHANKSISLIDEEINNLSHLFKKNINKVQEQYGLTLLYSLPENIRMEYENELGFNITVAGDYYNLGVMAINKNDLKNAIKNFKLAIKSDPKHLSSYYNMGLAYEELGDKAKALDSYNDYINTYEQIDSDKSSLLNELVIEQEERFYNEIKVRIKNK